MKNSQALDFFQEMAKNNPQPIDLKISKKNSSDYSQFDADFVCNFADKKSKILDLGSGSGLMLNKIYQQVASIVAVEPFVEFSKFICSDDRILVINQDLTDFNTNEKFDLITFFGVLQYFNELEAVKIYKKYFNFLKKGGQIIIKNQFGINRDVLIDGFSKDLGRNYYTQYRHLKKEISLLSQAGFVDLKFYNIYPDFCNRWADTHFYAIVGKV